MTIDDLARMMQGEFTKLGTELSEVKSDVKWMKDNSSELFTKLDKFITLYEDQKTELKSLTNQMERLEGRVAKLESKNRLVTKFKGSKNNKKLWNQIK